MLQRKRWVYAISFLPLLITALLYQHLPQKIPMQWALDGSVSRYGDKSEIWLVAVMVLLIGCGGPLLERIDPRRENYRRFSKVYTWLWGAIVVFLCLFFLFALIAAYQPQRLPIGRIVCAGVGILLCLIGNQMPKIKSNFYVGIKTPWTLSSDVVWYKTHRLGGKLFCLSGLILCLQAAFFPQAGAYVIKAVVLLAAVVPMAMSYVWFCAERKQGGEQ